MNASAVAAKMRTLKELRKKVGADADARFRQKLYYLLEVAAKVSPQWSGDFASNWNFAVNGNMPVYRQLADKFAGETRLGAQGTVVSAPHQAGDYSAVATSLARGSAQLKGVTLKSNVHLVNASPLDMDGTFMVGPDGKERLRPVNLLTGGIRIESYVRARAKEAK